MSVSYDYKEISKVKNNNSKKVMKRRKKYFLFFTRKKNEETRETEKETKELTPDGGCKIKQWNEIFKNVMNRRIREEK